MDSNIIKLIGDILSEVSKVVKSGDEVRVRELHSRITGRPTRPYRAPKKRRPDELLLQLDFASEFSRFASREELDEHLTSAYPTKSELAIVARALKAPVTKADNYDSLLNKIIDSTVGYRLRSEAIRGKAR